jgi:hypothetical protein
MAGAGLYYGQDLMGHGPQKAPSNVIEIDGYGKFEVNSKFFTLSSAEQNEVVEEIIEAQKQRIDVDLINPKDHLTQKEQVTQFATQAPGAWAGAKMALATPTPPVVKIPLTIAGAIAGGEATERMLTPVANALTPPEEWDDNSNQFKNLAYDFVTGQWDDW